MLHMQWPKVLNAPLAEVDPELYDIIEKEKNRQCKVRWEMLLLLLLLLLWPLLLLVCSVL